MLGAYLSVKISGAFSLTRLLVTQFFGKLSLSNWLQRYHKTQNIYFLLLGDLFLTFFQGLSACLLGIVVLGRSIREFCTTFKQALHLHSSYHGSILPVSMAGS